jgi:hypothetical protein
MSSCASAAGYGIIGSGGFVLQHQGNHYVLADAKRRHVVLCICCAGTASWVLVLCATRSTRA